MLLVVAVATIDQYHQVLSNVEYLRLIPDAGNDSQSSLEYIYSRTHLIETLTYTQFMATRMSQSR